MSTANGSANPHATAARDPAAREASGTRGTFLIIANPTSGRGRGSPRAEAVAERLRERGRTVRLHYTTAGGEAERIAADAASGDGEVPACVVACGGDGTVQEIANALARAQAERGEDAPPMALAPAGRCNDFARALHMPRDPDEVAGVLMTGKPRAIDLGCVNDRYFCTVATVGIDAEVSSFVDARPLPIKGTIAYLYGALCVLAKYKPGSVRIEGDFGVIEQPVFLASTANTSSYGGAIPIAPGASPTDGVLDLCVISAISRLRLLALLPTILRGRHRSSHHVQFVQTKRLTIHTPEPVEVWADGERIAQTPVTIEVAAKALRVLLPSGL